MFRSISQMKQEKKKYLIILLAAAILLVGGFSAWYLTGGFMRPVTGQIAEEDYRTGTKRFYRREEYADVFVITTSTEDNYGFSLMGLGKEKLAADPDDISSYCPGNFWSESFYSGEMADASRMLLVPMDARTYASWYTADGYEFASSGGLSWSVPWLAGLYALCVQVDDDLTPELFVEKAFETGTVQTIEYQGKSYEFGTIINPAALIEAL